MISHTLACNLLWPEEELEWFGLPREELVSLLAPAAALCDTDFDLQVDVLRFIGRPTIIDGASSVESSEPVSAGTTKSAQSNASDIEHASPRRKRLDSQTSSKRLGEQDDSSPVDYDGSVRSEGREAVGERRRLDARSNSQELLGERRTRLEARSNSQKSLEKEAQRIFHVVFVIDSRQMTGPQQGESVKAWQTLAVRLTAALLLEEKRTGYIAEEIATMRRLREEHQSQESPSSGINEKNGSTSSEGGSSGGSGGAATDKDKPKDKAKPLAQQFLEHSDLARVLEELYRGLVSPAAGAKVLINGWIRLDLYYTDGAQATAHGNSANASIQMGQGPQLGRPAHQQRHQQLWSTVPIAADQSYILLRSKDSLLAELPIYASPAVRAAIERANPCLSVYELADSMSISVERLITVGALLNIFSISRHAFVALFQADEIRSPT